MAMSKRPARPSKGSIIRTLAGAALDAGISVVLNEATK